MKTLFKLASVLAILVGIIMVGAGIWGIVFTYKNVAQEKIITAKDAAIPETPLGGPLTLKAQADIIRTHTLNMTGGKTYAEMSREDTNRNIWITATTLTTALNLAILTYVFSGLVILFGLISIFTGIIFTVEQRKLVMR